MLRNNMEEISFDEYIGGFDRGLLKYILPRDERISYDEALYGIKDVYEVLLDKTKKPKPKVIKYTLNYSYEGDGFYRNLYGKRNITIDGIKSVEDFLKIPSLSDESFKGYSEGEKFTFWILNIRIGNPPSIFIKKKDPKVDEMTMEFNKKGL